MFFGKNKCHACVLCEEGGTSGGPIKEDNSTSESDPQV